MAPGAVIKHSVIAQNCVIEEGVSLEYVMTDKNVVLAREKMLTGNPDEPFVVPKSIVYD